MKYKVTILSKREMYFEAENDAELELLIRQKCINDNIINISVEVKDNECK